MAYQKSRRVPSCAAETDFVPCTWLLILGILACHVHTLYPLSYVDYLKLGLTPKMSHSVKEQGQKQKITDFGGSEQTRTLFSAVK
jgi:hypothetical protein